MKSVILFIIDGLGDLPTPKTPLQAAKKPNMDYLAKNGATGLMSTISLGVTPGSDVSHLQIFGYETKKYYSGRGPLEALGVGLQLNDGDVAFRANFATVKANKIVDRRAGRITTIEAKKLENTVNMRIDDVQVIFKSSVEHRGALILRGPGLSPKVSDTDTHKIGEMIRCAPLEQIEQAKKTSEIVNKFTDLVYQKLSTHEINKNRELPANMVVLRSAGSFRKIPSVSERFGIKSACVAGGALYKGVAKYIGMNVIEVIGASGDANTNLKAKALAAIEASKTNELVFLHVKAVDSFGHDGNFKEKTKMLERIDKELVSELVKHVKKNSKNKENSCSIIITGDHSTPCIRKAHSGHEVPILIYGENERKDEVKKFDEFSCAKGIIGHIKGSDVMNIVLNLTEKGKMYGS